MSRLRLETLARSVTEVSFRTVALRNSRRARVSSGTLCREITTVWIPTPGSANSDAVCGAIAKEIRSRYTIGYAPPAGSFGALRHIRVYVSAPGHSGLTARTRTSYRYEPLESRDSN